MYGKLEINEEEAVAIRKVSCNTNGTGYIKGVYEIP